MVILHIYTHLTREHKLIFIDSFDNDGNEY